MTRWGAPCSICGEWITWPTNYGCELAALTVYVCSDCNGETKRLMQLSKRKTNAPGRSDREYHGGQFNAGEW